MEGSTHEALSVRARIISNKKVKLSNERSK